MSTLNIFTSSLQVIMFLGFAVLSVVTGLLFYLIFEAPVESLLNLIYEKLVKFNSSNF